jgi:hypothetical protein
MSLTKKFSYQIIVDKSLIIESYNGKFTVNELIEFKKIVGNDIYYNPNFNIVHDFRGAEFQFKIEEISKYIKLISENKKYIGNRKSTMLTATPNQVATSIGFDMFKKDLKIDVNVCSTFETAFDFVGLHVKDWGQVESQINKLKTHTVIYDAFKN